MILKVLTFGAIALLILLRLTRTPLGARLLGVSRRVLDAVYFGALLVTGVLAAAFEQWILLGAVVVLLVLGLVEEVRRRSRAARLVTEPGRAPRSPRSRR
ncbi:hypothetical protein V1260_02665 [Brachybacterium sp. J144]|uniref:hypothetical protein n=1 Tax=Brachybacterium sp. J144 TaxID=3116487 RepID=UPI002E77FB3B|nr:hypothetical protein [Brachybacterium sp. J144]MEE1649685.1 hypothetical protein [Brachybacterium sp. J144]